MFQVSRDNNFHCHISEQDYGIKSTRLACPWSVLKNNASHIHRQLMHSACHVRPWTVRQILFKHISTFKIATNLLSSLPCPFVKGKPTLFCQTLFCDKLTLFGLLKFIALIQKKLPLCLNTMPWRRKAERRWVSFHVFITSALGSEWLASPSGRFTKRENVHIG